MFNFLLIKFLEAIFEAISGSFIFVIFKSGLKVAAGVTFLSQSVRSAYLNLSPISLVSSLMT